MKFDFKTIATFGVAGNFTGHLEQAGEAASFTNVEVKDKKAPKAVFPTYIPGNSDVIPDYLKVFPFDSEKIVYPENQDKLQIEPECVVVFDAIWENDKISDIKPLAFGASNDCSIRKEGVSKISMKKNWGESSKAYSSYFIPIDTFSSNGNINDYRITSFLVRDNDIIQYGEDSAVKDYSYIYDDLKCWIIDKLNNQVDNGSIENIYNYLIATGKPTKIAVSIGATRYTDYGEHNFLQRGDKAVVVLYPSSVYNSDMILNMVSNGKLSENEDIVFLSQLII